VPLLKFSDLPVWPAKQAKLVHKKNNEVDSVQKDRNFNPVLICETVNNRKNGRYLPVFQIDADFQAVNIFLPDSFEFIEVSRKDCLIQF
jgi:hypothetical protein